MVSHSIKIIPPKRYVIRATEETIVRYQTPPCRPSKK